MRFLELVGIAVAVWLACAIVLGLILGQMFRRDRRRKIAATLASFDQEFPDHRANREGAPSRT